LVACEGLYPDREVQIWYDLETVYGTGAGAMAELGKVTSFNSNFSDEVQRLHGLGEGRNETSVILGNVNVTANIEWQPLANFASARSPSIDFMKFAVGGIIGAGSTADPYDIVESENYGYTGASDIPTFQLEIAKEGIGVVAGTPVDDTVRFIGGIMPSLTVSAAVGGLLTARSDIRGQSISCDASDVEVFTTETGNPMTYQQGSWAFDATPTTVNHVQNFSITTANNPLIYRSLGSRLIRTPITGQRKWDWNTTMMMSSAQASGMRNDFLKDAATPFVFDTGISDAAITADMEILGKFSEGATTNDLNVQFLLDDAYIMSMSESVSVGGGLVQATFTGGAKSAKTNFVEYWKAT